MNEGQRSRTVRTIGLLSRTLALLGILAVGTAFAQGLNDTLMWAHSSPPRTLDPHITDTASVTRPARALYEGLLTYAPGTLELIPLLAEAWEVQDDGAAYLFHIRQGVTFHDGSPLNAEAVKASFDRYNEIGTSTIIEPYNSSEVIDEYTVRIVLDRPTGAFLYMVPKMWIISKAAIDAHNTADDPWARAWFLNNAAGTGPYQLVEWLPEESVTFERHDSYWQGWDERAPQRVIHRIIREASTQRLMLERGEIDIAMNLSIDAAPSLRANPNVVVQTHDTLLGLYARMALTKPPLDDVRVRRALQLAFDQASLLVLREGLSAPLPGPLPTAIPYSRSFEQPFDLEEARALLAEAGYGAGGLEMTYRYTTGFEEQRRTGELLQSALAQLGISLNIVEGTYGSMVESWGTVETTPEFSAFFLYPSYPDPDAFLYQMYASGTDPANGNPGRYGNDRVDDLIFLGQTTSDPEQRRLIYSELQELIVADAPDIFVSNPGYFIAMRDWVEGYTYDPAWHDTIDFYQIRLNK